METENKIEDIKSEVEAKIKENKLSIPMAIIVAGVLIAGAIYFSSVGNNNRTPKETEKFTPVTKEDRTFGNTDAKVALVIYADFQCPFCGAILGSNDSAIQYLRQKDPTWTPFMPEILNNYVKNNKVLLVYRDFPFLGPESGKASESALCAKDQNKFWEYHDYLFSHQNGENEGGFSDINLKSFAKDLGLDTNTFNDCLDKSKYAQTIEKSKAEATSAGVTGTPKGYILKNGKIVDTIDGAESLSTVKPKIESALK